MITISRLLSTLLDMLCFSYIAFSLLSLVFYPPMSICLCFYGFVINYKLIFLFFFSLIAYVFILGKQTLGKRIFRLQVVDKDTHLPASFFQIIKRNLILLLTFGASYIWLVSSKGKYTLHDKLSNTTVIRSVL